MKISKNITKLYESDFYIFYRAICSCCDPDCDANIEFEYDKKFNILSLNFFKKLTLTIGNTSELSFFKKTLKKLNIMTKILFNGYVEMDSDFLIQDVDQIDSFIDALIEGKTKMLNAKDKIND